jgi:peptidoglycan/LPS O-acetylase OafA/YrhL
LVAFYDGIAGNFLRGGSPFNNVLWTMRFELLGSFGVFALYWMTKGRVRLILIVLAGTALLFSPRIGVLSFFAFLVGTLLYEAQVRGAFENPDFRLGLLALVVGILLGAPGRGAAERWDLPIVSGALAIGEPRGLFPVLAAGLLLYAVLCLRSLSSLLSSPVARWLGRISFALYLVHVPLLYTIIATLYIETGWSSPVLAICYAFLAFSLAHIFTILVDEPSLRFLGRLRVRLQPWELPRGRLRLRRRQGDQSGA